MNELIFYPRLNIFTYIIFSIIILILIIFFYYIIKAIRKRTKPLFIQYLLLVVVLFLIGHMIFNISIYHTMKYIFSENNLILSCGPYKDIINCKDIKKWEIRDLKLNILASFRFPGFALKDVLYSDLGIVRMYSTSSLKNVLLLYTNDRKYGISPYKIDDFINELKKRVNQYQ
ncbi:MAG: PH domain-containing protein [Caldisericia bacterium]|nr:PH domain-containing protein [Caldisericia bacterium]